MENPKKAVFRRVQDSQQSFSPRHISSWPDWLSYISGNKTLCVKNFINYQKTISLLLLEVSWSSKA
jgi:hypothetical protein